MDNLTDKERQVILQLAWWLEHDRTEDSYAADFINRHYVHDLLTELELPRSATIARLVSLGLLATDFRDTHQADGRHISLSASCYKILGGVVPLARRIRAANHDNHKSDDVAKGETDDTEDLDAPALEQVEVEILRHLSDGVVRVQYDLSELGDRKVIGRLLKHLRAVGYVSHPTGKKRGNVITPAGMERLKSLSQTSPKYTP